MGKKSLTKSTTKKKTAAAKKSEPTKKIDTAKKSEPVKKQVAAPTAKPAAAPKKTKESTPKKPTIIEKPTIASLIQKDFGAWAPESKYTPQLDPAYTKNFTAPPFIETSDPKEVERINGLLLKTIDLTVIEIEETPAPEKIKPTAEAKPPVVETPQPTAEPEIKKPAPESIQVKEEATQSPRAEIKEEAKVVETPKAPEKQPVQSAPKEVAPKQAAPKPPVSAPPAPAAKTPDKETDPSKPLAGTELKKTAQTFDRGLKLLTGCIAVFFALLVLASGINAGKYYLMPSESGLEIWKGKFSPSGKKLMISIPGIELKEPLKHSYTKEEALAPVFNNYLRQADELSAAKGTPDFEAIKDQLKNAADVAPTDNDRDMALKRLSAIDFTFLLYKANSASSKKTPESIEKALGFLNEAKALDLDNAQLETLEKKINELKPPVTR